MIHTALIPWLDPESIIGAAGPWALLVVCFIVFAETGLLVGFLLPGDTLLVISGLLSNPELVPRTASSGCPSGSWRSSSASPRSSAARSATTSGTSGGPKVFERKESGLFSVKNVERTNAFFERFGGLTIILARFVPIVRTFALAAAGVGHMNRAKYSLYNFIGAVVWGFGLTMFGYAVSFIPPVADLVRDYIDVILLIAVGGTALITAWHYFSERHKAKKAELAGEDVVVDDEEAEHLVLDPECSSRGPDGHADGRPPPQRGGTAPRPGLHSAA